jgi:serine/threonine-protein kinase
MSPEQVRGEELDGRSDIFSLGCVLYEAATGTRPFGGSGSLAVMHEIATAAPPPPSGLRAGLPDSFDRLIAACLEKDPTRRPATAALVAERLKTLSVPERVHVRSNGSQSVAVIPFRFRTGAAEDRFLSVALAEAVINRLGANGHLLIRPISSVMRYAGTDVDCSQVARDLNVDLVIEGSIQKLGPRLRVMVQALQMSDSRTLHSSLHDGDMGDLFTLQDRLADAVSGTFAVRTGTSAEPALPPTQNALAYELYMRAAELVVRIDKFDLSSAIGMLSRAVELDPQFADAWGRLAQAYANMGMHLDADPRWFEQADLAIARTLEIDPVQCEALCARAQVLWSPSRGFQNRPALRAINAALKVNPHRPLLRQFRSVILLHLGYYGQAERDANETLLANPEYAMAIVCQATTALYRGDYEASTAFYDRVLTLDPGHVLGNIIAPLPLLYSGRIAEAREQVRKARQMVPSEAQLTAIDAMIAVLEGDFRKAGELADDVCSTARKSVTHTHHSWHCSAGVYALIGEPEKALAQLRRCGELGLPNYRLFRSDPWLKPLRELPEFTALMSDLVRQHDQYCVEIDAAGRTQTEKEPSSGGTR